MKFAGYFSKCMGRRNELIELLETDYLIELAHRVVQRYKLRKAVPEAESQDVEMSIIEKFLKQKERIVNAFEGKAAPETYCIAILNRMCCEVIRQDQKHWYHSHADKTLDIARSVNSSVETEIPLMYQLEVQRLSLLMHSSSDHPAKLMALLSIFFDLKQADKHLMNYAGNRIDAARKVVDTQPGSSKTKRYQLLAHVVSLIENRTLKPDAARMWLYKEIDQLIEALNKNGQSQHNRETIRLLFELWDAAEPMPTSSKQTNRRNFLTFLLLI